MYFILVSDFASLGDVIYIPWQNCRHLLWVYIIIVLLIIPSSSSSLASAGIRQRTANLVCFTFGPEELLYANDSRSWLNKSASNLPSNNIYTRLSLSLSIHPCQKTNCNRILPWCHRTGARLVTMDHVTASSEHPRRLVVTLLFQTLRIEITAVVSKKMVVFYH